MFRFLLLSLSLVSFLSHAQADSREGLADQVLMKSGTYEMIASFPEQIHAYSAQQSPFAVNQEAAEKAISIILSSFNEADSKAQLVERVAAKHTAEELNSILDWINSPLGNRFIVAELEAGSVEGQNNMMRYAATFSSNPPSETRIKLIQEFEENIGLTDLAMQMVDTMMSGIGKAAYTASEDKEHMSEQDFTTEMKEILNSMEPMMRQQMWQQMILTSHYSYRDFSDEEIRHYIDYLNTASGQAYVKVGEDVLHVITQIFTDVLYTLVEKSNKP